MELIGHMTGGTATQRLWGIHEMSIVWLLLVFLADWRVNYHCIAPCMCSHTHIPSGHIPIHNGFHLLLVPYPPAIPRFVSLHVSDLAMMQWNESKRNEVSLSIL